MRQINGDITEVCDDGIIIHQVNCMDEIGAGVSGAIIRKYPKVEKSYHEICGRYDKEALFKGYQTVHVSDRVTVVNSFTQLRYGNSLKTGISYTDEESLIRNIRDICRKNPDRTVYVPDHIGCALAGGDWSYVLDGIRHLENLVVVRYEPDGIQTLKDFSDEADGRMS